MTIKCGIVGLPNVGKSTLFNALTAAEIRVENYPFCTIDPNVGVVPVPDPRLDVLTGIVHPQKTIPTTMEFVDIAGLVEGASKGEGLGNKFLGNIRETHALAHGNFVVGKFAGCKRVLIDPGITDQIAFEVITFEIALSTGALARETNHDRREIILEISGGVVDDFAPIATDEHPLIANMGEVLIASEVEYSEPIAKIEIGDSLFAGVRAFCLWRPGAVRPFDKRRSEFAGGDSRVCEADPEEFSDQTDARILLFGVGERVAGAHLCGLVNLV